VDIGNADSVSYTIGAIVDGYYTRNASAEDTLVTVSKPYTAGFITGGGYLTLTSSAGLKAGDVGSKDNFGFNVKFNKTGKNLQGTINTIIHRTESDGIVHVYQIKGNSLTSLSTSADGTATFNGKASIQDITNPLAPISVDGNASLQVTMTDKGEPGSADTIGITVWNKSGGLWFASNWNGTKTVEQKLAGGNLVVRKALQAADGELTQGAVVTNVLTQEQLQPIVTEALELWRESGADVGSLRDAAETMFQVVDLSGADLGQASAAGIILIDQDAAGHGWFVDPTPADNSEFTVKQAGELLATSGTAAGHIDLLTVVMHEFGHMLGYEDIASSMNMLMSEELSAGIRHLPENQTISAMPAAPMSTHLHFPPPSNGIPTGWVFENASIAEGTDEESWWVHLRRRILGGNNKVNDALPMMLNFRKMASAGSMENGDNSVGVMVSLVVSNKGGENDPAGAALGSGQKP
jgi:hypothetical protein